MNKYLKENWYEVQEPEEWFMEQDKEYITMDIDVLLNHDVPKRMTPYDLFQIYQSGVMHIYSEMLERDIPITQQELNENTDALKILYSYDKLDEYHSKITLKEAIQIALEVE